MNVEEVIAAEARTIVPTYRRPDVVFSHGRGVYLYDTLGNAYLDFTAGIAVTALGHSDEIWARAVADQARQLTQSATCIIPRRRLNWPSDSSNIHLPTGFSSAILGPRPTRRR